MAASTAARLLDVVDKLREDLAPLSFGPPAAFVYNPLDYALASYRQYIERYAEPGIEAVFMGMNPGPFGMAQTGVPFGDAGMVRDWLGIEAPVGKPEKEHPKRPVEGFDTKRGEVSGRRLWGWARDRFETPERFFERFFVVNYCPLLFLEASGRNLTPDKRPRAERDPLLAACDSALAASVAILEPKRVIGIGVFAEGRAKSALAETGIPVGRILHPSPASPAANDGWAARAEAELKELGVRL
jgi:single-strand selective monofunctional uracil DNA glycosylase